MLDFDEIIANVKNPQIRKYLQEAIKSYSIGNYRSAILAVWVATMFDLVQKFKILVEQREPSAIGEWNNGLEKNIEDHKNWEQELIRAAKRITMISRYEADTLESLSKTRNRYAHPSFDEVGILFDPTPEEVRYFIRTLYDIVLSQPAQLGSFYVNQILASIKGATFFSNEPTIDELILLKQNVVEKVIRINSRQIPRLVKQLFQDLSSPSSKEHKLNIICFLVNIWAAKVELQIQYQLSSDWENYILNQELDDQILEGVLNYPECINQLSQKAQDKVGLCFKSRFFDHVRYSESAIKFLAVSDVVPLAKSILEDASKSIPINKLIQRSSEYKYLFGNKFSEIFGTQIFDETRQVLKTLNGYNVNPILSLLRECEMWNLADNLISNDQLTFAKDLMYSLNSNNFETMDLLSFSNRKSIPIKWSKLIFEQWTSELQENTRFQHNLSAYIEHYLGLYNHYINELDDYSKSGEIITIVNSYASKSFEELESNEELWKFWQSLVLNQSSQ